MEVSWNLELSRPENTLMKIYNSWDDLPSAHFGDYDDLDGVMVYHCGSHKSLRRLVDRMIRDSPKVSVHQDLTKFDCEKVGVLYPARVVGLYH
jgi:hypothetical protein